LNWAEACGAGCKGADRSSGASGEDAGGSGVGGGVTAAGFTVVPQPVQNWSSDSRGVPQSVQKAIYAAPATRAAKVLSTTRPSYSSPAINDPTRLPRTSPDNTGRVGKRPHMAVANTAIARELAG
jgi:hypothetical protein